MQSIYKEIIISIVIFLIFLFLRKVFTKYIIRLLKIFTDKTQNSIDDKIIKLLIEPIRFLFIIIGLYISSRYISLDNGLVISIFKSLFIFTIFWVMFDLVIVFEAIIKSFAKRFGNELHEEISSFLIKVIKIFIAILGIVSIFDIWNINIGTFVASLGLGGLAFALAAKDTAANLFGGLTLLADKSLKLHDWIKVGDVEGIVEDIGLRTTRIRTFEKSLITVPNQILANTSVENFSRRGIRRIKFRVGLTYDTSSTTMKVISEQIKDMLKNHQDISQDSTMLVRFDKFEDSSLSIFIYTFTSTAKWDRYLEIKEDINIKIMKIVEDNKSEFAFPTSTIHLQQGNIDENS